MANSSGNAYGLTLLCPIKQDSGGVSFGDITSNRLEALERNENSPMAKVPNTYLCRFYVLDDVFYEGYPEHEDHLKSRYLVFCCNFHGKLDEYLEGMWKAIASSIRHIWEFCVAFERVNDAKGFIAYVKKCQVKNTLFFNGSTDDPLAEQLKALYIKQELSRFAFNNHGKDAAELQQAFDKFITIVKPEDLAAPTWQPGIAAEKPQHNYENHL